MSYMTHHAVICTNCCLNLYELNVTSVTYSGLYLSLDIGIGIVREDGLIRPHSNPFCVNFQFQHEYPEEFWFRQKLFIIFYFLLSCDFCPLPITRNLSCRAFYGTNVKSSCWSKISEQRLNYRSQILLPHINSQ